MGKRIVSFVLFIILIGLLATMFIFGIYIYQEFCEEPTESVLYKIEGTFFEESDTEKNVINQSSSGSIGELIQGSNANKTDNAEKKNGALNYFFYSQLSNTQKKIYEGLMQNKQSLKQGNYVIYFGNAFSDILSQEGGADILGDDYQSAIEAFTHDNVDIFYVDFNKMYLNIETTTRLFKTTYNVYISAAKDSNYLSKEFQSTENIEKAIMEIEQVKKGIMNSLNGSDYQNMLYIHDYLVNNIEYDSNLDSIGSFSIYGALVQKKCVCEGYAKAFKYLANSAGYECELIQGTAANSSGETENHAWNCIKLNNNWYEIDVTWDDPIIIGGNGRTSNQFKYRYFLKGARTFEKDHTFEYNFSEKGRRFSYPNISQNDY